MAVASATCLPGKHTLTPLPLSARAPQRRCVERFDRDGWSLDRAGGCPRFAICCADGIPDSRQRGEAGSRGLHPLALLHAELGTPRRPIRVTVRVSVRVSVKVSVRVRASIRVSVRVRLGFTCRARRPRAHRDRDRNPGLNPNPNPPADTPREGPFQAPHAGAGGGFFKLAAPEIPALRMMLTAPEIPPPCLATL